MQRDHYYEGGYQATAAAGNRCERWDLTAGTYTRWLPDGTVDTTRPLTADETASLKALDAATTAAGNVYTLAQMTGQAISDNDTYLALTAPTAADQLAQIRRLTRQSQAMARYLSTVVPHPGQVNNLGSITDVTTA